MAASHIAVEVRMPWYVLPVIHALAWAHVLGLPVPSTDRVAALEQRVARLEPRAVKRDGLAAPNWTTDWRDGLPNAGVPVQRPATWQGRWDGAYVAGAQSGISQWMDYVRPLGAAKAQA